MSVTSLHDWFQTMNRSAAVVAIPLASLAAPGIAPGARTRRHQREATTSPGTSSSKLATPLLSEAHSLPITDQTRGHGTHSLPAIWKGYLADCMKDFPRQ